MGWLEWKHELNEANKAYEHNMISRDAYKSREKYAIYMIFRCGNEDAAEGIAKAHGYRLEDLVEEYEKK